MRFIIIIVAFITACVPPVCDEVQPDYTFKEGERPIFKATGEKVRVVGIWSRLGGACDFPLGEYTIQFEDRAEIHVNWYDLRSTNIQ